MKHAFSVCAIMALLSIPLRSPAQSPRSAYWVVETPGAHQYSIVRIHDARDTILQEIRIDKKRVDLDNRRHRRYLDSLVARYNSAFAYRDRRRERIDRNA